MHSEFKPELVNVKLSNCTYVGAFAAEKRNGEGTLTCENGSFPA